MTPSEAVLQATDDREGVEVGSAEDESLDISLIAQLMANQNN